jgi:hypothetical protein
MKKLTTKQRYKLAMWVGYEGEATEFNPEENDDHATQVLDKVVNVDIDILRLGVCVSALDCISKGK